MTVDQYIQNNAAFMPLQQQTLLRAAAAYYSNMVQGQQGEGQPFDVFDFWAEGVPEITEEVGPGGTKGGKYYRNGGNIKTANLLWFGPKGTVTPIHHDLTNNMLVQIYGRKKITLIPSFQVPKMYNDKGVYSAAEYPDYDKSQYPLLNNVQVWK